MTWIKTILPQDADPALRRVLEKTRALYPPEYDVPVEAVDESQGGGVTLSHTLIPQALLHAFGLMGALMSPDLPLERRHQEMIATVVSAVNRCVY
jgi:alkylhydroperoxidase family enzyme